MEFHYNLTLNAKFPNNPYKEKNLCAKCYREVYENSPALPVEKSFDDKPVVTNEHTEGMQTIGELENSIKHLQLKFKVCGSLITLAGFVQFYFASIYWSLPPAQVLALTGFLSILFGIWLVLY